MSGRPRCHCEVIPPSYSNSADRSSFSYRKDYKLARGIYAFIAQQLDNQASDRPSSLRFRALGRVLRCDEELGNALDIAVALQYLRAYAALQQVSTVRESENAGEIALCQRIIHAWSKSPAPRLQQGALVMNRHAGLS